MRAAVVCVAFLALEAVWAAPAASVAAAVERSNVESALPDHAVVEAFTQAAQGLSSLRRALEAQHGDTVPDSAQGSAMSPATLGSLLAFDLRKTSPESAYSYNIVLCVAMAVLVALRLYQFEGRAKLLDKIEREVAEVKEQHGLHEDDGVQRVERVGRALEEDEGDYEADVALDEFNQRFSTPIAHALRDKGNDCVFGCSLPPPLKLATQVVEQAIVVASAEANGVAPKHGHSHHHTRSLEEKWDRSFEEGFQRQAAATVAALAQLVERQHQELKTEAAARQTAAVDVFDGVCATHHDGALADYCGRMLPFLPHTAPSLELITRSDSARTATTTNLLTASVDKTGALRSWVYAQLCNEPLHCTQLRGGVGGDDAVLDVPNGRNPLSWWTAVLLHDALQETADMTNKKTQARVLGEALRVLEGVQWGQRGWTKAKAQEVVHELQESAVDEARVIKSARVPPVPDVDALYDAVEAALV